MDILSWVLAKKYANSIVSSSGLSGKNIQISDISEITGGNRITFSWYDEDNVEHTSTLDVMDGEDGLNGSDGANIWTTSTAPTSSNGTYVFIISNLTGNNGTVKVGDIVLYSYKYYQITSIDSTTCSATSYISIRGSNGTSPTITSSEITGGHRLTITDANETSTVDVMNGIDGTDGEDGANIWTTSTAPSHSSGTTIYTFTISNLSGNSNNTIKVGDLIFYSYYYYRVTSIDSTTVITDGRTNIRGTTGSSLSFNWNGTSLGIKGDNDAEYTYVDLKGETGSNGTNGVSPTIATSSITGGHRLTITDANGTNTVDVMDGTNGTNGSGTDVFSGKKVLFLGDSFIQGYGCHVANNNANAGTTTYSNMSTVDSSNVAWAKSFYDRHSDATVRNIAIYGATFAQSNSRVNIWGELYYFYVNVSNFTPDYIIFDGGANDAFINSTTASTDNDYIDLGELSSDSNYTSFYFENVSNANNVLEYEWTKTLPSLEAFISFAQRRYPSAKLIYVEEPEINQSGVPSATKAKMMYIKSEIRRACDKWGVTYLKITDRGSLNGLYYGNTDYYSGTDAMHPRQKFYDETIDQIEQAMLGDKQMLMTMATNKRGLRFWNVSNEEYGLLDDAVKSNEKNIFNVYKSYNTNNLIDESTIFSSLSTSSSIQINGKDTYVLSSGNSIDIYNGEPPLTGKLRISVDIKASAVDSTGVDWVSNLQAIAFDSESNPYYIPIMLYNTNVNTLEIEVSLNTNVIWFKLQLNAGTNPAQTLYFNNVIVTNSIYKQTYLQSKTYEDEVKKHKLFNKQIVLFGDSIMYGAGNYGSSFIPFLSEDFRNACGIANKSVSGAVVSYTSNTTVSKIITQMENYFALCDADLVMFNGGINDSWDNSTTLGSISSGYDATLDTTTFCGAFEEILRYLRVTKNVKVIYMTTYKSPASPDLNTYMDKALEICRKWGVPVLDLFYGGQLHAGLSSAINNAYFLDDGNGTGDYVHLTDDGYKFYASQIEDALLCGGYTASLPS